MKNIGHYFFSVVVGVAALAGCGGSGGSHDSSNSSGSGAVLTGTFVDSPVENLHYRTATQSGSTGPSGDFRYILGEKIIFSIGLTDFPAVDAQHTLMPSDLWGSFPNNSLVNALRLLQTLDKDGDPANGLQIDDMAHEAAANLALDFGSFSFDSAVAALVTHSGSVQTQLVTADQAKAHFNVVFKPSQILRLVGAWQPVKNKTALDENMVITFLDGAHYAVVEPDCAGVQFGSFTWDPLYSESLTTTIEVNTLSDSCPSLFSPAQPSSFNTRFLSGGELYLIGWTPLEAAEIFNTDNRLLGSWVATNVGAAKSTVVLTFLPDGRYVIAAEGDEQADPSGRDGYEAGTYTWNASTGTIATTITAESGIWRLNDGTGKIEITDHPPSSANAPDRGPDTMVWTSGAGSIEFTHAGL